jgi:hypothetical protein
VSQILSQEPIIYQQPLATRIISLCAGQQAANFSNARDLFSKLLLELARSFCMIVRSAKWPASNSHAQGRFTIALSLSLSFTETESELCTTLRNNLSALSSVNVLHVAGGSCFRLRAPIEGVIETFPLDQWRRLRAMGPLACRICAWDGHNNKQRKSLH